MSSKKFFLSDLDQNKLKLYVFKMDFMTNQLKLTLSKKCEVTRVRIPILTEGVLSKPGVRGGASLAYSAVPKSQELGSPF